MLEPSVPAESSRRGLETVSGRVGALAIGVSTKTERGLHGTWKPLAYGLSGAVTQDAHSQAHPKMHS